MQIVGLFREDHLKNNPALPPSKKNPGGGVVTKVENLKLAVPSIELVDDALNMKDINIVESLWFSGGGDNDSFEQRMERYCQSKGFKIMWTSDVQFLHWRGEHRERIFDATNVIAGNSLFMQNLLAAYTPEPAYLTDPVDIDFVRPASAKEPVIFGISNIIPEKNVQAITNIYRELPTDLPFEKGFIGSSDNWGLSIKLNVSKQLENDLFSLCDWTIPHATRAEVRNKVASAWCYVADSKYDTFCYGMIEAMLAGCWTVVGNHPIYRERPCLRFNTTAEAVELIVNKWNERGGVNEGGRQFVIDHYSLDVFRRQLKTIIGDYIGL